MKGYSGYNKPYIWVYASDALKDGALEVLEALEKEGILFWCPKVKKMNWKERRRMDGACAVLLFVLPEDLEDPFFRQAVDEAVRSEKRILTLYWEKEGLNKGAWARMQLDSAQALFRQDYPDRESFLEKLKQAAVFAERKVTAQQKTYQKRRGLGIVLIPLAAAAVLFVAVVYPLLIVPMRKEKAAQEEFGLQGLTKEELEGITELTAIGQAEFAEDVVSVGVFMENATRTLQLNIGYADGHQEQVEMNEKGTIEDLSVLKLLPNLEYLELDNQKIRDISPLYSLKKLKGLRLSCNPIDSIEGIEALTDLEELDISGTNVSDLSPLVSLEKLTSLRANACPVSVVPELACMKNGRLEELQLDATLVTELPYLGKLKNLRLHLHNLPEAPADYSFLKDVESIQQIGIDGPKKENLLPWLKGIPIEAFSVPGSDIESFRDLSGLSIVNDIDVCHSQNLRSLEGIEAFQTLKYVNIKDCLGLTDLTPLYSLPQLESITVSSPQRELVETQLKDLEVNIEYSDN